MEREITVQSNDGQSFDITYGIAKRSAIYQLYQDTAFENLHVKRDDVEYIMGDLILRKISAKVLEKVIDWCQHEHEHESIWANANSIREEMHPKMIFPKYWLTPWELEFVSAINAIDGSGNSILFDTAIAANYLDIQSLTNLTTMEIARMMKGKTPEEIRDVFKIGNDLILKHDLADVGSSMKW